MNMAIMRPAGSLGNGKCWQSRLSLKRHDPATSVGTNFAAHVRAPQRTPLMVALQILCMAGIDFRTMIAHNPQPAGQVSLPKHLGNVDYSKATCNPAYNAAEDRQTWQARPTTSHSCPQPRKSTLYSR